MGDSHRETTRLRGGLWSVIDNGAEPGTVVQATERYLAALDGKVTEHPAVLVAAANRLEAVGRKLQDVGEREEALQVLGVALRAAGEAEHLVLIASLLGLREELLLDLNRSSDDLQRRYLHLLSSDAGPDPPPRLQDELPPPEGEPSRLDDGGEPSRLGDGATGPPGDNGQPAPPGEHDRPSGELFQPPPGDPEAVTRSSSSWEIPDAPAAVGGNSSAVTAPPAEPGPERPAGGDQQMAADADVLDLRDYLEVLRRQRWLIVAVAAIVVASALGFSLTRTPVYESTAQLLVEGSSSQGANDALRELVLGDRELSTFSEVVDSEAVAEIAAKNLEGDPDPEELAEKVSSSLVTDTQLLEISATDTDPERAAAVTQAFAEAFLTFRSQQVTEQLSRASQSLQNRREQLQSRLDEINAQLEDGDTSGEDGSSGDQQSLESEKARIESELAGLSTQQASLSGSQALARGGGKVMRSAQVPDEPVSPTPIRTGALAAVLGLMLGVGFGFLRDFLDDTVRSESQAVRAAGAEAVGRVPTWKADKETRQRLVTLMEPASPVAEAYRTLRTNVRYLAAGREASSLLVTSPLAGEGKTTTAGNLAVAMADAGLRTLLVGADLRRPKLHQMVGLNQEPGLMDLLINDFDLRTVLHEVGIDELRVIPAGTVPPNPAELLGSEAMRKLAARFEQTAQVVIYDAAPVLAVADTLELSRLVGMDLMVVDIDASGRRALERATGRLRGVGADIAGLVLNNVHSGDTYYGDYYSGYYTTADETA